MRSTAIRALTLVAVMAGTLGCQSGPRWAWWKRDQAPEDRSLLARTAAPPLPSTQSTPQSVAIDGLTPAAPPSSTNLAAAGGQPAPTSPIPATSAATIASAPLASYPAGNALPGSETPAPGGMSPATGTSPARVAAASVPPAGPYDPNAYQPSASFAAAPSPADAYASADRYASAAADRYAMPAAAPSSPMAATPEERYNNLPTAPPAYSPAGDDRYGLSAADRYSGPPATPAAAPGVAGELPHQVPSSPNATASAQFTSAPGQYRPGGTSSYASGTAAQHQPIEVATRPSAPPTSVPTQAVAPTGESAPWTPPPPATPGFGSDTWTY